MSGAAWVPRRRLPRRLVTGAVLLGMLLAALPAASGSADPGPAADPEVTAGIDALRVRIDAATAVGKGHRTALQASLSSAERKSRKGDGCQAAHHLEVLGRKSDEFRMGAAAAAVADLEDIRNRAAQVRADVLASVGPPAECAADASATRRPPEVTLGSNDAELLEVGVQFAPPTLTTVVGGGETFTQVHVTGLDSTSGNPGVPAVPVWRTLVGIPEEADVALRVTDAAVGTALPVNLVPFQPEPADQDDSGPRGPFGDAPFTKSSAAYATKGTWPPSTCGFAEIGRIRDLRVGQVSCAAGRYQPSSKVLELFSSLSFALEFRGGTGSFLTTRALEPFEPRLSSFVAQMLNSSAVASNLRAVLFPPLCSGAELVVLTHPSFRAAADRLATWKRAKGIPTAVFNVNDGQGPGPDSPTAIDDLLGKMYEACAVRPSYVLIMGDAEFVPTWTLLGVQAIFTGEESVASGSDYLYALHPNGDLNNPGLPTFALGRIPVDTLDEADVVVDKIVAYESTPPSLDDFYQRATIASYFQCCRAGMADGTDMRGFIETSEGMLGDLVTRGFAVDRIYNTDTAYAPASYSGATTPRRYYDGTLLPPVLRTTSGFTWPGNRTMVLNAINAGRFLVVHRDHGSQDGWVDPPLDTTDIASMTNGELLPVVLSINCASGYFDNETSQEYGTTADGVYFAEQLLRQAGGGAVGVIGDTRNSPTWANNAMLDGLHDAAFPSFRAFGPAGAQRRLGDMLNHAKAYMVSRIGVSGTLPAVDGASAVTNLYLYHVIGDPTLEMWTRKPQFLRLDFSAAFLADAVRVAYAEEGADVTAWQVSKGGDLRPIGRAQVRGGEALVRYFLDPEPSAPILLSAGKSGFVSRLLTPVALPTIDIEDTAFGEGTFYPTAGTATLTLSEPSDRTVRVRVRSHDGSAVAPDDYTQVDVVAEFSPGETAIEVALFVAPDELIEGNEIFDLELSDPEGAAIGRGRATVTIIDDDRNPFPDRP